MNEWRKLDGEGGAGKAPEPHSERRIAADEPRVPAGAWQWPGPVLLAAQCVSVCGKEEKSTDSRQGTAQPRRTRAGKCGPVCEQAARV